MKMYTRKQLLSKECTHRQYYAQFVTSAHKEMVKQYTLDGSNKTPLHIWDNTPLHRPKISFESVGDYLTLSGKVCILKEARKQLGNA